MAAAAVAGLLMFDWEERLCRTVSLSAAAAVVEAIILQPQVVGEVIPTAMLAVSVILVL
jgi:hypothetical protein